MNVSNLFERFKKGKAVPAATPYDPATQKPILRCSICTGEQVAGFRDLRTGKFTDIMLIRNEKDLEAFRQQYGVTEITKEF